jgi:hypothetical protein
MCRQLTPICFEESHYRLGQLYAPQTKILEVRWTFGNAFRSVFQRGEYTIWATFLWKVVRKFDPKRSFGHPKSSFGSIKFPNISTTVRGYKFRGIRKKAGLSKRGRVADGWCQGQTGDIANLGCQIVQTQPWRFELKCVKACMPHRKND